MASAEHRRKVRLFGRGVVFERASPPRAGRLGDLGGPGGAQVAWFKDPDGNVLSLTQGISEPRSDAIVPEIFVDDGARALAFYTEAFDALEISP